MRAYECTCCGVWGIAVNTTRRKAAAYVARSAVEEGFAHSVGDAFKTMKIKRAPWYDLTAAIVGRPSFTGPWMCGPHISDWLAAIEANE